MKKKLVSILMAGVLMAGMIGCGNTQNISTTNADKKVSAASVKELSKEQVVEEIEKYFSDSNFACKEVNYNDKSNTLEVKVAVEGMTESLNKTKHYDVEKGKKEWESIKENYNNLCLRINNQFIVNGYDDVDVSLLLVDDVDKDNALFSSLNGAEHSDYMK